MSSNSKGDVFTCLNLANTMPKYEVPTEENSPRTVYQVIHDELMLDGNSRQNLATFCQTWLDPEIHQLMDECLDKNLMDRDEYPQTAEIESRCVQMLADLWHSPNPRTTIGCSTTGSSEAAMLGGMSLKWQWREKMQAQGKSCEKPNLVTGPVQICWHKFCRYWDIELRVIPMEGEHLIMRPEDAYKYVEQYCDENTIGFVSTLGVTYTGQYEPVQALNEALDKFQEKTGIDIPIHVDGASGAFLAPFMEPELLWDFKVPRVKSINASGHKFGLSPLGIGWIIWREESDLPRDLIFNVNYLGSNVPTFGLNFSRPGGQVVAQYYNLLRLGREGYKKIHQSSYDTALYLSSEIERLQIFKVLYDGKGGIPCVTWTFKNPDHMAFSLYDLSDRLKNRGWQVPAYSMPENREDLVVMRALVRYGFTKELGTLFINDLRRSIDYLMKNPPAKPLTEEQGSCFCHTFNPTDSSSGK